MKLTDALRADCISTGVKADSRDGVLREISHMLAESGFVPEGMQDNVYAALRDREEIGSTGFGHGVAIPHCRVEELEDFFIGVLVLEEGVDFEAVDGEPVRIVPFLVGPDQRSRDHLTLLSSLAQLLRSKEIRNSLLSSRDAGEIYANLTGGLPAEGPKAPAGEAGGGMRLVHVFVQEEDVFDEVLQVFAATETFSTVVLEAHESTDYLAKTPLFAGFWDAEMRTFNRVILATVKEELVNAVIRNIEYVCGRLDERDGVMVAVSPLLQVAGRLGM